MKKLFAAIILTIITLSSVWAEYKLDWSENNVHTGGIMTTTTKIDYENTDNQICTMDYRPVCAQVEVQCVTTPCNPIDETFSNACSAWDNKIIYTGECNSLVDSQKFLKYKKYDTTINARLNNLSQGVLSKMIVELNERMSAIENTKIAVFVQVEKTTQLAYIKELVLAQLAKR